VSTLDLARSQFGITSGGQRQRLALPRALICTLAS
jgi:ABC-type dipeptide/oligopeptide/nickel transport system ATPase subunit